MPALIKKNDVLRSSGAIAKQTNKQLMREIIRVIIRDAMIAATSRDYAEIGLISRIF